MVVEGSIKQSLDMARMLDEDTKILVHYFLAKAAEQATEEVNPWIESAVNANADVCLEVRIVRFVDSGHDRSTDVREIALEILEKKIRKLENLASLAASHATDLRLKHDLPTDAAEAAKPEVE